MRMIKEYIVCINNELDEAAAYAEKYLMLKMEGSDERSKLYWHMADEKVSIAKILHRLCVEDINRLNEVIKPDKTMLKYWQDAHKDYENKLSFIKNVLSSM